MKNLNFLLIIFSVAGLISCDRKEKEKISFGELSRLEGNWVMEGAENPESNFMLESWTMVNDTLFTGIAYEVVNSDSTLAETIRLVIREGQIYYIPSVTDQNKGEPVPFKLTKSDSAHFVFENPDHDFPNTISYEFLGKDSLIASIAGRIKGEPRSMEFYYERKP